MSVEQTNDVSGVGGVNNVRELHAGSGVIHGNSECGSEILGHSRENKERKERIRINRNSIYHCNLSKIHCAWIS
jgi:hypothetical protein